MMVFAIAPYSKSLVGEPYHVALGMTQISIASMYVGTSAYGTLPVKIMGNLALFDSKLAGGLPSPTTMAARCGCLRAREESASRNKSVRRQPAEVSPATRPTTVLPTKPSFGLRAPAPEVGRNICKSAVG